MPAERRRAPHRLPSGTSRAHVSAHRIDHARELDGHPVASDPHDATNAEADPRLAVYLADQLDDKSDLGRLSPLRVLMMAGEKACSSSSLTWPIGGGVSDFGSSK